MTNYTFTPFNFNNDAHYEAMGRIKTAMYPLYPNSVATIKRRDNSRPAERYRYRVVVSEGTTNHIRAVGEIRHTLDTYHPQKFQLDLWIEPEHDTDALRTALDAHLTEHVAQFEPIQLSGTCNTAQASIISFYERNGYEMKTREYSSRLDLNTFDSTPFQRYLDQVAADGIEIFNVNQLADRYPETWKRMVYEVAVEVEQDVPWYEPIQPIPYDHWLKRFSNNPDRIHECYLIALAGDEPVGITMLFKTSATTEVLFTGLTGVKRSYRRRGVAVALKVQSLSTAKAIIRTPNGNAPVVMTENEANNPMYTINERLGFVRQPDWLNWVKTFKN